MAPFKPGSIAVALVSCTGFGCVTFHATRPVEVTVTRTDSAAPVGNAMVQLHYVHTNFQGAPHPVTSATDARGRCLGYASTSPWRPKPAYSTTVESSVYCHSDAVGQGCGTALYAALFKAIEREDIQTIVAGVCLPNPASV